MDKHPQIPGMGTGAAGSVLMANQATLRPSPILPTLLEVALSSCLSFSRVPEGLGMDFCWLLLDFRVGWISAGSEG